MFDKFNKFTKLSKLSQLSAYKPYINYNWNTTVTDSVSYLKNIGTSSTNAEMFTGRGLSFNSASSQIVRTDIASSGTITSFIFNCEATQTATTARTTLSLCGYNAKISCGTNGAIIRYSDGVNWLDKSVTNNNYKTVSVVLTEVNTYLYLDSTVYVLDIVPTRNIGNPLYIGGNNTYAFDSIVLQNLIILNEALTPQQISDYHTTPHTFLYKDGDNLASDSGLDTSKVVSWFPMTEDDGYVRDVANYSEGSELVTNGTFDTDLNGWVLDTTGGTPLVENGRVHIVNDGNGYSGIKRTDIIQSGKIYIIEFDYEKVSGDIKFQTNSTTIISSLSTGHYSIVSNTVFTNALLYFGGSLAGEGYIDNVSVKEISGLYPISNYTTDMPLKGLNYGLQTAKLLLDDNGVVTGKSDYCEFYGDGYVDTGYYIDYTEAKQIEFIIEPRVATPNFGNIIGNSNSQTVLYSRFNQNSSTSYGTNVNGYGYTGIEVTSKTHIVIDISTNGYQLYKNCVGQGFKSTTGGTNSGNMIIGTSNGIVTSVDNFIGTFPELFEVHTIPQDITELYNKAIAKGLLS